MIELGRLRSVAQDRRREDRLAELRDLAAKPPAGEAAILAEAAELLDGGVLVETNPRAAP